MRRESQSRYYNQMHLTTATAGRTTEKRLPAASNYRVPPSPFNNGSHELTQMTLANSHQNLLNKPAANHSRDPTEEDRPKWSCDDVSSEKLLERESNGNISEAVKPEVTITSASEAEREGDLCAEGDGNTTPEEVKLNSEVRKFHQVIMKNQPDVATMVTVRDQRDQWL